MANESLQSCYEDYSRQIRATSRATFSQGVIAAQPVALAVGWWGIDSGNGRALMVGVGHQCDFGRGAGEHQWRVGHQ